MKKIASISLIFVALLALQSQALTRVPGSITMIDFHTGWSSPFGSYSGIGPQPLDEAFSVPASDLYDPTFHFGVNVGQLSASRMYFGLGLQYTKIDIDEKNFTITPSDMTFHQWDFNVDMNFYPVSPQFESVTPYVGPGLSFGLTTQRAPGYRSQSQFNLGLNANFGVDVKIWQAPDKRSLITLSSINSWTVVSGGNRPRYLNIGGGLRYFFRP